MHIYPNLLGKHVLKTLYSVLLVIALLGLGLPVAIINNNITVQSAGNTVPVQY